MRERIANGVDFAEQARLYSQDGSAAKGGDLGWLNPGDTVPEFEAGDECTETVTRSARVVQSPFGMHLIQVRNVAKGRFRRTPTVRRPPGPPRTQARRGPPSGLAAQLRDRTTSKPPRRKVMSPRIAVTSGEPAGIGRVVLAWPGIPAPRIRLFWPTAALLATAPPCSPASAVANTIRPITG